MVVDRSFADLWIWERVGDRLPWYLAVATNRMPAKYLIASRVPCEADLAAGTEEDLWAEHARLSEEFLGQWHAIRAQEASLADLPRAKTSLVDLSAELAKRTLRHCTFCRWNCRVDRIQGTRHGACQLESSSRVSSYFHHEGEELVFRGTRGSGTIFFTSCCLKCQFCQNGDISHDKYNGIEMNPAQLAAMVWELRTEGCHNINWVGGEPTIHLHNIVEAIRLLTRGKPRADDFAWANLVRSSGFFSYRDRLDLALYDGELNAPMLWNSNFFMSDDTVRILRPLMDVWLPDFKFGNDRCAVVLAKTPWYWETVSRNHKAIYDGGEDVVIRHLVMPGHVECCTKPVLTWIAENMPHALVNVMDQYHPDYACNPASAQFDPRYRALARRPRDDEIEEAYACARQLRLRFEDVTFEKATRIRLRPRFLDA
jgi:putative pyruvate formate lyase activating enzyme